MGIAERKQTVKNAAFTNMASVVVLRDAKEAAGRLGREPDPEWTRIADAMVVPRRGKAIVSHDDYRRDEQKGATPDPLMGIWPFGFPVDENEEQATLKFYLDQSHDYIGSPMLSALYGAWAARSGNRRLALKMLDEGYAQFTSERFLQTLEYRRDKFPEQPVAGPFFANISCSASLVFSRARQASRNGAFAKPFCRTDGRRSRWSGCGSGESRWR
jgi:hypothetical protein